MARFSTNPGVQKTSAERPVWAGGSRHRPQSWHVRFYVPPIPNLLCGSIKHSRSTGSCLPCVISFLVTKLLTILCSISLNIHRMNVRYNKGMSTIHEHTTSCGTSCFIMVTLIWAVFHAIPSPQGLCHTEAPPGVVTAIGLGAQ